MPRRVDVEATDSHDCIGVLFPVLSAVLLLQDPAPAQSARPDSARDSVHAKREISVGYRTRRDRGARRIPVTAEHMATAFRGAEARRLLLRARAARMRQDSALQAYEATAYLRISAGMGFSRIGRNRLLFRHENVTNVKWDRDVGAWIDVKGARTAIPVAPREEQEEEAADVVNDNDMVPVPWYPGQEPLLAFNSDVVRSQVDDRELVHPLAEGAEAYYTYTAGDSISFRLPDGKVVALRELQVRPRKPAWNVAVGSLWFDLASGQLVRAAYRLAEPLDVWAKVKEEEPEDYEEIPIWVRPMLSPMRAQVTAIAVEYGLYQGQFWLPRQRLAEGDAQVSFMRVPFRYEQSFRYASVNVSQPLPQIRVDSDGEPPDSLTSDEAIEAWRDSVREVRRERRRAEADSVRKGLKEGVGCDSTGMRVVTRRNREANLNVAVRIPCDVATLANSPELPKSIYDEGEEIFGSAERDALIKEALAMGAQPPLSIGAIPPALRWGLEYTRFNRIEGLSTGVLLEQKLGGGYTASLVGRIGYADLEPNVELALSRTNLTRTITLRGYNRLVSASDWGNPLAFGSSLSSLLFGLDEGFYYRASGAELEWVRQRPSGARFSWRLFAEQQRTARKEIDGALGPPFIPNIQARTGGYAGLTTRFTHTKGLDPNGFRLFTDARLEGAMSDSSSAVYGRGAVDLTVSDGFGPVAAALTLSGGSSAGPVPTQRRWFLGGAHTVRGQPADTARAGDAYWLGRLEIGTAVQGVRPVIFGDIGWTGPRELWRDVYRPMSGVGVGASALDGLFRLDLARGIYPRKAVRLYLYVDARF